MGNIISSKTINCNYPCDKISKKELKRIEALMHNNSNSFSASTNFITNGQTLGDLIKIDQEYLKSVYMTCEQVASCLELIYNNYRELIKRVEKEEKMIRTKALLEINAETINKTKSNARLHYGNDVLYRALKINDNLHIGSLFFKGAQYCPFRNKKYETTDEEFASSDLILLATINDKYYEIKFGLLAIHMIRTHGFFGGDPADRIDPQIIVPILKQYTAL